MLLAVRPTHLGRERPSTDTRHVRRFGDAEDMIEVLRLETATEDETSGAGIARGLELGGSVTDSQEQALGTFGHHGLVVFHDVTHQDTHVRDVPAQRFCPTATGIDYLIDIDDRVWIEEVLGPEVRVNKNILCQRSIERSAKQLQQLLVLGTNLGFEPLRIQQVIDEDRAPTHEVVIRRTNTTTGCADLLGLGIVTIEEDVLWQNELCFVRDGQVIRAESHRGQFVQLNDRNPRINDHTRSDDRTTAVRIVHDSAGDLVQDDFVTVDDVGMARIRTTSTTETPDHASTQLVQVDVDCELHELSFARVAPLVAYDCNPSELPQDFYQTLHESLLQGRLN
ncbi:MAG: hypothetical protein UT32_C0026G0001 [Parcubacteria group bacterium GW2011_GWC2_39_14]|nr:MAG: hypothetical protein UT32_C0026G0001 [Parcubacteria group bacterium GW2011_GWC2_39_14]KKR53423.1 MAG: hypothetical protein UT91_C0027G0001 [Parcubacteria group bacterium GW2011_GWA2_40_23]